MTPGKAQHPIIVIKRKGGHGGHHGGAWKVAYADFVTAMMSLFIVLWLMNSSDKIKKAVAGYFNDPRGTGSLMGTTMTGTGVNLTQTNNEQMKQLKEKLEAEIAARKELEKLKKQMELTVTPEGLRIEMLEDKNGTFFETGGAQLSQPGRNALTLFAGELKKLPNSLLIEGHTDAQPYAQGRGVHELGVVSGPGQRGAAAINSVARSGLGRGGEDRSVISSQHFQPGCDIGCVILAGFKSKFPDWRTGKRPPVRQPVPRQRNLRSRSDARQSHGRAGSCCLSNGYIHGQGSRSNCWRPGNSRTAASGSHRRQCFKTHDFRRVGWLLPRAAKSVSMRVTDGACDFCVINFRQTFDLLDIENGVAL